MKLYILLFFALGVLGFIFEWAFRILTGDLCFLSKMRELAKLLMIFVYGIAGAIIRLLYAIPFFQQMQNLLLLLVIGGVIATIIEFGFGYLFNIVLKLGLWDYSNSKIKIGDSIIYLNFRGQIDIWHTILWCALTLLVCYFSVIIEFLINY